MRPAQLVELETGAKLQLLAIMRSSVLWHPVQDALRHLSGGVVVLPGCAMCHMLTIH